MIDVNALMTLIDDYLLAGFIAFLRIGPIIMLFPGTGESSVPVRYKLLISLVFTLFLTPMLISSLEPSLMSSRHLVWLILTETCTGVVIGVAVRFFLLALQTAGSIAAQATSLAMIFGNAGVTPMPAIGHLLMIGGIALAMIVGLHVKLAETIVITYDLFPVSHFPTPSDVTDWGIRQVAATFALAFTLAAPFLIVSMLYNVTLGVINRAMPQMMVVFIGAPVITGAGMALLLFLSPEILTLWVNAMEKFMINPFGS